MAVNHCPVCPSPGPPKFLADASKGACVHYHLCPNCFHIWATTTDDQTFLPHTTRLPEVDQER